MHISHCSIRVLDQLVQLDCIIKINKKQFSDHVGALFEYHVVQTDISMQDTPFKDKSFVDLYIVSVRNFETRQE
jgi:hypothetical protein